MPRPPTAPEPQPVAPPDSTPAVASLPRVALRYRGDGAALPGIPPRDLSLAEAAALSETHYADAVASGLYGYAKAKE